MCNISIKRSSFARSLKEDTFIAESCIKEWSELESQIYLSPFCEGLAEQITDQDLWGTNSAPPHTHPLT